MKNAVHLIDTVMQPPKDRAFAPIGVFDSGVGGLSVVDEIFKHLPHERMVYLADTAHVPYGARLDEDIQDLTARAVDWLYQKGCKAVVIACNTASAFSLDFLRQKYGPDFPILGLVPALKPAVLNSQSKVVAVLATPATFRGRLIHDVIEAFAQPLGVDVLPITSLELVPIVEEGRERDATTAQLLQNILQPAVDRNADYLVLGCTHYPFLKTTIESVFASQFTTVDSGRAVAHHLGRTLAQHKLMAPVQTFFQPQVTCYFTGGMHASLQLTLKRLLIQEITWDIAPFVAY
ncbi:glutamate racemase [Acinetobacter apis]|uniref:Glutamate racemase n=2 Tax=Acinetobacter apis TaxID=1229165 RepID=A0A217EI09_9GAMM|nr:glutamate racemase [Acinetobacter apis]